MADGVDTASGRPRVGLDPDEPAQDGFRRVLSRLAATIDDHVPPTITDDDPEHLHELRVAVRRTRSLLRASKGVLPAEVRQTRRGDFAWLGGVTGPARDLDVYLLGWPDYLEALDPEDRPHVRLVRNELLARRRLAHAELEEALRSARFMDMLGGWRQWLANGRPLAGAGAGVPALGAVVARRVARAHTQLVGDGRLITDASDPEALHELRKTAKQLRYLIECFGDVFDKAPRKEFVRRLKGLQENLGAHHDADVHIVVLREIASVLDGHGALHEDDLAAIEGLAEVFDDRRRAERADFSARFAEFDETATREAFELLLAPLRSG